MSGQAKLLAASMTDRELISPQGFQLLIAHFDALYEGAMKVTVELDFDAALFSGSRQSGESFLAFVARKTIEFSRYEHGARCQLPDQLKLKFFFVSARLQRNKCRDYLRGLMERLRERSETAVRTALGKLDTDLDVTLATSRAGESKILWQADGEDYDQQEESYYKLDAGTGMVLAELSAEENDVGYDSDDENYMWILAQDGQGELDEEEVEAQFANFAAVQRAKQAHKVARGWFAPSSFLKGKGKGKGLKTNEHFGK
eukprot:2954305-Amphidinium_carterae.1